MAAQRRQEVVRVDADHEAQLPARPGARRHGVDRAFPACRPSWPGSRTCTRRTPSRRASGRARPSPDRSRDRRARARPRSRRARACTESGNVVRHPFGNADLPGRAGDGRERMGQLDRRARQEPAPVAGMMPALARIDPEIDREAAARAERDGRAVGRRGAGRRSRSARRRRTASRCSAQSSRRPGEPVSSPISISHLALKPSLPRVCQHRRQRRDVDRVLALVVGDAAAVVAAVALGEPPWRQAGVASRPRGRGSRRHGRSRARSAAPGLRCARANRNGPRALRARDAAVEAERLQRRAASRSRDSAQGRRPASGFWLSVGMATRRARSALKAPESK